MTDVFSGIVNKLLEVEKTGDLVLLEQVLLSMDEMWAKMNYILSNEGYNELFQEVIAENKRKSKKT